MNTHVRKPIPGTNPLLALLGLAAVLAGCAAGSDVRPPTPAAVDTVPAAVALQPGFDVAAIVRRVHLALDAKGVGFDPVIGPELGTDAPVYGTGYADWTTTPAIAFDGTDYLVVWWDSRDKGSIFGARVSGNGVLLDPGGIAIGGTGLVPSRPAVAFGGGVYLIAWQDRRSGNSDIYGMRVSTAGAMQDPAGGVAIGNLAGDDLAPAVGWNGGDFLVAWEAHGAGSADIRAAHFPVSGPSPFGIATISAANGEQTHPAVAWDGGNWLIVWTDTRADANGDIYGARFSSAGVLLDAAGLRIGATSDIQYNTSVAWGGGVYFVTWTDGRGSCIYGARVSSSGAVLDGDSIRVGNNGGQLQDNAAVEFDGSDFFVVWESTEPEATGGGVDLRATRVSAAGQIIDAYPLTPGANVNLDGTLATPALCLGSGAQLLIAWVSRILPTGDSVEGSDVASMLVSARTGATVSSQVLVSSRANDQRTPVVAWDGTNFLVVWSDDRRRSYADLYGVRVTPSGVVLDAAGIAISNAPGRQLAPSVAFDGNNYLVVWQDDRRGNWDIYATRVSRSGQVLDEVPVSLAAGDQEGPRVAFNGASYLVVWAAAGSGGGDIYGGRVSTGGAVLDGDGFAISIAAGLQAAPALACNPSQCLAVWTDGRDGRSDLYGARVKPSGQVVDAIDGLVLSTGAESVPTVASDGSNFLVSWADGRDAGGPYVYANVVTAAGTLLGAIDHRIADGGDKPLPSDGPAAAWGASGWTVAYHTLSATDGVGGGIRLAALDAQGAPTTVTVSDPNWSSSGGTAPTIAWGGSQFLVVNEADEAAPLWSTRARIHIVSGLSSAVVYTETEVNDWPKSNTVPSSATQINGANSGPQTYASDWDDYVVTVPTGTTFHVGHSYCAAGSVALYLLNGGTVVYPSFSPSDLNVPGESIFTNPGSTAQMILIEVGSMSADCIYSLPLSTSEPVVYTETEVNDWPKSNTVPSSATQINGANSGPQTYASDWDDYVVTVPAGITIHVGHTYCAAGSIALYLLNGSTVVYPSFSPSSLSTSGESVYTNSAATAQTIIVEVGSMSADCSYSLPLNELNLASHAQFAVDRERRARSNRRAGNDAVRNAAVHW